MFSGSLSCQIEYIVGKQWNAEYNKWLIDFCKHKRFKYHYMSKINWHREFKKIIFDPFRSCFISMLEHGDLPYYYIKNCAMSDDIMADITVNPNITLDIIKSAPHRLWNWQNISRHPNITWDIIQANPKYPWRWDDISANPNITWEIIKANPEKKWEWEGISANPNITWDIMKANSNGDWDWWYISSNPNTTWDIIEANFDENWNAHDISQHPNITWAIIQDNPLYEWDISALSFNPNITWAIINKYSYVKWNMNLFVYNKFTVQAKLSMAKHRLNASRITNYLFKYCKRYDLVAISLEYGY